MIRRKLLYPFARIYFFFTTNFYRFFGIKIGKGSYVYKNVYLDIRRGQIIIGKNVHITRGCTIISHIGFMPQKDKPTIIEDNVLVMFNSTIFPGVTIGENSVIYPGSVVTKDIPPGVIVMGNPGKIIGKKSEHFK